MDAHTMNSDMTSKVLEAVAKTGYPLELQIASVASRAGWTPFHAIQYADAETKVHRELDLLIYKQINERRIEMRISCKSSINKQFVFFNIDRRNYIPFGDIKCTPVVADVEPSEAVRNALISLPMFNEPLEAVNYTVVSGNNPDRNSRSLLHEALMSVLACVHYRLIPAHLLLDERGSVYLFVVVLKAPMFNFSLDSSTGEGIVKETPYAHWRGKFSMPDHYHQMQVLNPEGRRVPLANVMYWFGDKIHVEILRDTYFGEYLQIVEAGFNALTPNQLRLFGKPWRAEHFPKIVGPPPPIKPRRRQMRTR